MKSVSKDKRFFNRLRKPADRLHRPLPEDYFNSITRRIRRGELDLAVFEERLRGAPIFRRIRLAYALNYRLNACDVIVYRVRNGRGFASRFEWPGELRRTTRRALDLVTGSIADSLRPRVGGRTVYLPPHVHYALPATEKQFTGGFPSGSYVAVPDDMIVGIHWTNTTKRVDLDLSVIGESGKIGWDDCYRSRRGRSWWIASPRATTSISPSRRSIKPPS